MQSYREAIEWLEAVPKYSKKDGLCNMYRLMERLGDPQETYQIIHVAGTNGKGSCVAMLSSVLECAGYRVGRYISPHLVSYTERMSVNGCDIPEAGFLRLADKVREAAEALYAAGENHPTFFELVTAIAFLYFAEERVDYVVLETGVGGRLDATNIIAKPAAALIASISLDHTKVLGSTVGAIAGEKAGIIKKNCPIICGKNPEEAVSVIRAKAREMEAPLVYAGDFAVDVSTCGTQGTVLSVSGQKPGGKGKFSYKNLRCPLTGSFQKDNIAAVLGACEVLLAKGILADRRVVRKGIRQVYWPGRMEYVTFAGREFLIDGAHNPDAAKRLCEYLMMLGKSVTLVYSALAKKDVAGVVGELGRSPYIRRVIFAPLREEDKPILFEEVADLWYNVRADLPVEKACSTEDAMRAALSSTDELLLCAGSLYFIGEIKEVFEKERRKKHAE